jgi:small-conductance mechanosensitive channel
MSLDLVVFDDVGDSALIFDCCLWIDAQDRRDMRAIRRDIRFRIVELSAQNNIEIAFSQQDQHIDGAISGISEASTSVPN